MRQPDISVVLGIPIDNLTMDETVEGIFSLIEEYERDGRPRQVATVNVDFLVQTFAWRQRGIRHPELLHVLRRADLVTADGMPIVWTSKLLGVPLKGRVTGSDLLPRLVEEAAKRKRTIFFLGGREDVAQQAAEVLKKSFPGLQVAGVCSPYVHIEGEDLASMEDDDRPIVDMINASGADLLLIGLGNPKQELWFERNKERLKVPVSIGIGGSYEFIVGSVTRAPEWMQKAGLEWLFRITQDPKRLWKRYFVGFFKFGLMVLPAILHYRLWNWFSRRLFGKGSPQLPDRTEAPLAYTLSYVSMVNTPERLDAAFLEQYAEQVEEAIENVSHVVLNLSKTSFVDSTGLGFIIKLWRRADKGGTNLFLIGITKPSLVRFFKMNRIWDVVRGRVFEDVREIFKDLESKESLPPFYFVMGGENGFKHIQLYGRLDATQMSTVNLATVIKDIGDKHCVLDLENLDFVDSTGLIFFLKILKHCAGQDRLCMLCQPKDNIRQMFKITKLHDLFRTVPDMVSARKELEG